MKVGQPKLPVKLEMGGESTRDQGGRRGNRKNKGINLESEGINEAGNEGVAPRD